MKSPDEAATCSGSILDATHVLTAAHCTFEEGGQAFPASDYHVFAGLDPAGGASPEEQFREVRSVRVEPNYRRGQDGDDVAVLEVTSPFVFGGASVASIPVIDTGQEPVLGSSLRLVGWGQVRYEHADGAEHYLDQTRTQPWDCSSGAPTILCAVSRTGSPCSGDSGGGLVQGTPPTLVAVMNFTDASETPCMPGEPSGYTDLATPEVEDWLAGDPDPPQAPRASGAPQLGGAGFAGGTLTCAPPPWSPAANLSTLFVDLHDDQILQAGSSNFLPLTATEVGAAVSCISVATNAGGTSYAGGTGWVVIEAAPAAQGGRPAPPAHRPRSAGQAHQARAVGEPPRWWRRSGGGSLHTAGT